MGGGSGVDITALLANAAQEKPGGRLSPVLSEHSGAERVYGAALKEQALAASKRAVWPRKIPRPSNSRPEQEIPGGTVYSSFFCSDSMSFGSSPFFGSACWVTKTLRKNAVIPVSDFCTSSSASLSTISQVGANPGARASMEWTALS